MKNILITDSPKNFWVWINPNDFLVKHNIGLLGKITTIHNQNDETLMFIPNPNFNSFVSPFQNNIVINYIAEYNLEIIRRNKYLDYPSRLEAIFLFESEEEANKYSRRHFDHVGDRILKKCKSDGVCFFSKHDSSWINFLRIKHSMDNETIDNICDSYWSGELVIDANLISTGEKWSQEPIIETLFFGSLIFENRSL